jgi:hypothetical protein
MDDIDYGVVFLEGYFQQRGPLPDVAGEAYCGYMAKKSRYPILEWFVCLFEDERRKRSKGDVSKNPTLIPSIRQ